MRVLTVENEKDEKFLRQKAAEFDFEKFSKKEIEEMLREARKIMREKDGAGLAANQIGLDMRFFIAESPILNGRRKFYAVFNPKIEKTSEEKETDMEGCLSVPGIWGEVKRYKKITAAGQDKKGKKVKIKVNGFMARVFQHEIDHLNGILFIDKAIRKMRTDGEKIMKG